MRLESFRTWPLTRVDMMQLPCCRVVDHPPDSSHQPEIVEDARAQVHAQSAEVVHALEQLLLGPHDALACPFIGEQDERSRACWRRSRASEGSRRGFPGRSAVALLPRVSTSLAMYAWRSVRARRSSVFSPARQRLSPLMMATSNTGKRRRVRLISSGALDHERTVGNDPDQRQTPGEDASGPRQGQRAI